jgi:hypothetical protein
MNRKETIASLAIVGMALLATIITATTPTQALAIDYGSPDLNYRPSGGFVEDGADSSGTTDNTDEEQEDSTTAATTGEDEGSEDTSNDKEDSSGLGYEAFQDCLANAGESPTEQEVQDCIDSSYCVQGPNESTEGNDNGDTGMNQELSATDLE